MLIVVFCVLKFGKMFMSYSTIVILFSSAILNCGIISGQSVAKFRFSKFLADVNESLYTQLYSDEIGLLDWSYGNIIGMMLQGSYVFQQLGEELSNEKLTKSDLEYLTKQIDEFEMLYRNRVTFKQYIDQYSQLDELRTALMDMEQTFTHNFAYKVIRQGQTDMQHSLESFRLYWNKLDISRDGMAKFVQLVNETKHPINVINLWRNNQFRCNVTLIRQVFFHIQTNMLRYYISLEVCKGFSKVKCENGISNLWNVIKDINYRMMKVLNHCWKMKVEERARKTYAAYYASRFGSGVQIKSQPVVNILIQVFLAIFIFRS